MVSRMATALLLAVLLVVLPVVHSMCPKGSFIDESDGNNCKQCPIGFFNGRVDATRCYRCPANGYTANLGSTSRTDCRDCPPGMWIDEFDICETCNPGTYNPFVNGRQCLPCPKGTFSNTYNPSYCSPCRPGRVTSKKRTTVCTLCEGNKYQPQLGQKSCFACPFRSVVNPDGASCKPTCTDKNNKLCKICPKGRELTRDGRCVRCPEGTINAYPSNTRCQPCPDALKRPFIIPTVLVPNKGRTMCICRTGEALNLGEPFNPPELNPVCDTCPEGKSSNGIKCFV